MIIDNADQFFTFISDKNKKFFDDVIIDGVNIIIARIDYKQKGKDSGLYVTTLPSGLYTEVVLNDYAFQHIKEQVKDFKKVLIKRKLKGL